MSSVTQKIPNYIAGIAEQPDELKFPGQVRDLLNCVPDVTKQLIKRPGTRYIGAVDDTTDGEWFSYYRDEAEQYIGVVRRDGTLNIWDALTGTEQTVGFSAQPISHTQQVPDDIPAGDPGLFAIQNAYMVHTQPDSIQFLTIGDFTYITNREFRPRMTNATAHTGAVFNDAFVEVKILAYGRTYEFEIEGVGTVSAFTTADPTVVINVNDILTTWSTELSALGCTNITIIGNGIYFRRAAAFTINIVDTQTMNGFTDNVNTFTRLPNQCFNGMLVRVANTDDPEEDSFWVEFTGDNDDNGIGVWEEVAAPGVNTTFDANRMPHVIVRNANGSFTFGTADYAQRQAGDDNTNPLPSFIDQQTPTNDGRPINKILLFRNRLVFLAGPNAVCSQAGTLGGANAAINFFSDSVLVLSPSDPVDIAASSRRPATLFDGIEINNGIVLFGRTQQYLLTAEDSASGFAPDTAKMSSIANYLYDSRIPPISLGTTIGFTNTGGSSFRFFQMDKIDSTGEPSATELSKVVQLRLPDTMVSIAESKEGNTVFFANQDIGRNNEVWGYRYFDVNNERKQSAWFRWEMPGQILYHTIMRDTYYAVARVNGQNMILAGDISETTNTALINDEYRVHLDGRQTIDVSASNVTYDASANTTTFDIPNAYDLRTFTTLDILRSQVNTNVNNGTDIATTNVRGTGTGLTVDVTVDANEVITACTINDAGTGYFNGDTFTINGYPGSLIQYDAGTLVAYNLVDGTVETVTVNAVPNPDRGTVNGDWRFQNTGRDFYIGYLFNMSIDLPKFYVVNTDNTVVRSDTRASLVIHRFNIEAGASGVFQCTLKRLGYDDYTEVYYPNVMNNYLANSPMIAASLTRVIPCYIRNKQLDVELHSRHATPFTLFSISWEGDYSNKYYSKIGGSQ